MRPDDIDLLSQLVRIVQTPQLKAKTISLRDRVAESLGLPPQYPNTK